MLPVAFLCFILQFDVSKAATFNVPAQGQLSAVCNQATSAGDVIQIAAGNFTDNGTCYLKPGVKIIGAGKGQTNIQTGADPYISADSGSNVIDGGNEIVGISFSGWGTAIRSAGRNYQKIHDNSFRDFSEAIRIFGSKDAYVINNCGNTPPGNRSAVVCEDLPYMSTQPLESDWSKGNDIYNNDFVNTKIWPALIKATEIHDNSFNNSSSFKSAVGHTTYWWDSVDFYKNRIEMRTISWITIAAEVWYIQNDTKFRDNWTNGWFSLVYNPNGPSTPYSWEVTGNRFESNVIPNENRVTEKPEIDGAIESAYTAKNVLVANNYIENTGGNETYKLGIGVWGYGDQSNFIIRNNIIRNMRWAGILLQTTDSSGVAPNLSDFKIYNNTIDFDAGGDAGIYMNDGWGKISNIKIKNNIVVNGDVAEANPNSHDIRGIEVANNVFYGQGTTDARENGSNAFTIIDKNYNINPEYPKSGEKPSPYYRPSTAGANVNDKGVDVGLKFTGSAPDIGAYEFGITGDVGGDPIQEDSGSGGGGTSPSVTYGIDDFALLVANWMKKITNNPPEINADGIVNIRDLGIMMSKWQ